MLLSYGRIMKTYGSKAHCFMASSLVHSQGMSVETASLWSGKLSQRMLKMIRMPLLCSWFISLVKIVLFNQRISFRLLPFHLTLTNVDVIFSLTRSQWTTLYVCVWPTTFLITYYLFVTSAFESMGHHKCRLTQLTLNLTANIDPHSGGLLASMSMNSSNTDVVRVV